MSDVYLLNTETTRQVSTI